MDDLISRKAAMDTFMERPYDYYHKSYIVGELNCIPSVPAVPLNKLCEWLSVHAFRPIDCVGRNCCKCEFEGTGIGQEMCWKGLLTKWMKEEGLWTE